MCVCVCVCVIANWYSLSSVTSGIMTNELCFVAKNKNTKKAREISRRFSFLTSHNTCYNSKRLNKSVTFEKKTPMQASAALQATQAAFDALETLRLELEDFRARAAGKSATLELMSLYIIGTRIRP